MTKALRQRLRAALRIHEQLTNRVTFPPVPLLPLDAWRDLESAARRMAVAHERGWSRASSLARIDYRRRADVLSERVLACLSLTNSEQRRGRVQPPREILQDLTALEAEFDEVELDLKEKTLSVTTDAIVLEGINLGRFEIRLSWDRRPDLEGYDVIALDPHPAGCDSTVTHPHVRDDGLCEGDGRMPIRRALEQGRLFDFFVLVRQILETYNAGSAHVPLSRWSGFPCSDCGYAGDEDNLTNCDCCGSDLCFDCHTSCSDCGRSCCGECRERCSDCDESCCPSCLACCSACESSVCRSCQSAGRCGNCQRTPEEPNEVHDHGANEDETLEVPPVAEPAGAAV